MSKTLFKYIKTPTIEITLPRLLLIVILEQMMLKH